MTCRQLVEVLFEHVPEMKELSKQFCDVLGDGIETDDAMWEYGVMPAVCYMLREEAFPELLRKMFYFFEQMFTTDNHEIRRFYMRVTFYDFCESNETVQRARKQMLPATRRTFDEYVLTKRTECQWLLALIHADEELYEIEEHGETWRPKTSSNRGFRAKRFRINQFAPIESYVGAGGLEFGWTLEQVEQVTGPLGEGVVIEHEWLRYTVEDQLWLYFRRNGSCILDKIVTLPGYGGRLFSSLDTSTPVEDLSWREPSLVWNKSLKAYVSEKGVMIKPVDGKCGHIIIFNESWKHFVE